MSSSTVSQPLQESSYEYVTRRILEQAPSLEIIQRLGVGLDKADVVAATELGVLVSITPGATSGAVAEHTFALTSALAGHIPAHDWEMKAGQWNPRLRADLCESTLGIVGMGKIGKEVAKRAVGLGMNVLAYDLVQDEEFACDYYVVYAPLQEVLSSADSVTLRVPLNDGTRELIEKDALATM